ncbi:MAG: hypothetical protein MJK04_28590, partial [Psychrosphaera sp.]|nr:hypothetical protein [Psychrosphaera sp.]
SQCAQAAPAWTLPLNRFDSYIVPSTITTTNRPDYRVLILSPKWSKAYDISTKTIIEQFARQGLKVNYTLFNYNKNKAQAKVIVDITEQQNYDLIFTAGSGSTTFISHYYAKGAVPVVSVCAKDPVPLGLVDANIGMSQTNIAYTSLNIDVSTQIAYFKGKFLRNLSRIAVIYDINNPSSVKTQVTPLRNYLKDSHDGITLTEIAVDLTKINDGLDPQMAQFIGGAQRPGDSVFLITGSTELFADIDRINDNAKKLAVLSVTPSHVTSGFYGVFMAIGVSFKTNAKLAADYGSRILRKQANTQTLPVGVVDTPDISINFGRNIDAQLKVPFKFFEDAVVIYDHNGEPVRLDGVAIEQL